MSKAEQMSLFGQGTWCGKTSPEHCPATEAETLRQSWKKQYASLTRKPPVLMCLKKDGRTGGGYRDVDGRWTVAWRVHDAQFWGVPQRRRRISLVADFGGGTAHEILFERKSLSGDPEPGTEAGKGTPGSPSGCTDTAEQNHVTPYCISSYQSNAMLSDNPHSGIYKADVARTLDLNGGSPACNHGGVMVVYVDKEDR